MTDLTRRSHNRGDGGFTLLECLVVFVLMGAAALIVALTLTSAPTFMFRSVTHEVEIRRVQSCLAVMDAAYKANHSTTQDGQGMAAVIAASKLSACNGVTVSFEGRACTTDGTCKKPWKNEVERPGAPPDLLVVRLSNPVTDVVRFYAK